MQSTCDCGHLAQLTQNCSGNERGSRRFLCQKGNITPQAPSQSRTFLAGKALPPWETLAAPIPLQSIVTNAVVTGTFCRGNTNTHHCQTNQVSQAESRCHFTGCSVPNPMHQTAINKTSQEYQLLFPRYQAKKPRNRPASTFCSLGGSRMSSIA